MESVLNRLKSYFGSNSLDWFDPGYVGDWIIMSCIWVLASVIDGLPVFQRDFSVNDPLISHPHTKQQLSGYTNNLLSFIVPLCLVVAFSTLKLSILHIHHDTLGLWTARASSRLITEFLKNRVGRLRPDFLARCAWGSAVQQCTGKASDIFDGRRSFPSGHSSTAFAGMSFLFLWLSAHTAAWSFAVPLISPNRYTSLFLSRSARIAITLFPLAFATWVAVSRVEDYRHHKEDVIVGSLIGVLCGTVGYLLYWPNPFSHEHHINGHTREPRMLYRDGGSNASRNIRGYELASLEDAREGV